MANIVSTSETKIYQIKKWLGLNESPDGDTHMKMGEAAEMRNFRITAENHLQIRPGYGLLAELSSGNPVRGMWSGYIAGKHHVLAACGGHLWDLDLEERTAADKGAIHDSQTSMFGFSDKLYILTGTEYYSWDGEGAPAAVEGYIPIVTTAAPPTGGGTLLEPMNLLTGKKRAEYSPDGEAKEFQLPENKLDEVISVEGTEIKYTADLEKGKVTFDSAPPKGVNTITFTWRKGTGERAKVTGMRFAELYNGESDSRAFLYGDGTNEAIFSGLDENGQASAEYFPQYNTVAVDSANTPITAMIRHYDRLLIFKTDSAYSCSYSTLTLGDGSVSAAFYTSSLNRSIGNAAPGQAKLVDNNARTVYGRSVYKAAWADWANVQDVLSGNKYDDIRTEINSRRRIFRTAPLEAGRKINSWALEAEDAIFKRITYADALAGYLQSNGVTAEQMRNNTVDAQILSRARDYAGREALKATYQDRNMVSDKVVQIARDLGPAGEAVLPFKRTPANILVRGMEYSPAGLAKALTYDLIQVKRGRMTGAEAIDHIASGLTGSGLMALGAYLFAQGIVTSGGGDDEGQDAINDLTGVQNYALNLPGGGNVTLDWLAPEALPFFMGVELMDSMGQGGNTAEGISTALKSISDPMLELSMLQSLNDVIDSVSFSENKLGALVSSALVSYFTQPIPTFGGQIERSAEDVRMTTYTDKNLRLPTDIQYAIGRASARIPGWDYQQVPYIDAWGREEKSGTLPMRAMDNFLNPAYTSSMQVTDVDKEIQRLYNQTGDGGVVPDRPQKYITVDGERVDLTGEQYVEYATKRGQTQFKLLEELLDSSLYRSLGDEEKTQAVSSVYNYADMLGKAAVSDYQPEDWVAEAQNAKKEFGISTSEYLLLRGQYGGSLLSGKKVREAYQAGMPAQDYLHWAVQEKDTDGSGRTNQAETIAAIETSGLSQEEKDVLYAVEQVSDAGRRKWERARDWGLSVEDYQRYYAIYSGDGKKEEKLTALQRAGMTAAQANYFWSLMSKN